MKKDNFKSVNIDVKFGVGYFNCGLSARVYEDTDTVCLVDRNSKLGECAIIRLGRNPEWAKLLLAADNGSSITVHGTDYDETLRKVKDLKVKRGDKSKYYDKGIIMPRAWDYDCHVEFRGHYFGEDICNPRVMYISHSAIVKLCQENGYQVYQNGYTFAIIYDNCTGWKDGRLHISIPGVLRSDRRHGEMPEEVIMDEANYRDFCTVKDSIQTPEGENYIHRLLSAISRGWRDYIDQEEVIKGEFHADLWADIQR